MRIMSIFEKYSVPVFLFKFAELTCYRIHKVVYTLHLVFVFVNSVN